MQSIFYRHRWPNRSVLARHAGHSSSCLNRAHMSVPREKPDIPYLSEPEIVIIAKITRQLSVHPAESKYGYGCNCPGVIK